MNASAAAQVLGGQVIVVLGASSGIGAATARAAAAAGAHVWGVSSNQSRLERALGHLPAIRRVALDVTDERQLKRLAASMPCPDHVLLSATTGRGCGTSPPQRGLEFVASRLASAWYVAEHLRPADEGSLTFVTGGLAVRPTPGLGAITAAFAAVEGLARALAVELAPRRVNVLRPGLLDTAMWDAAPDRDTRFALSAAGVPTGRVGTAEELAHAALFVMTNAFVTGTVLEVNGGQLLVPHLQ